MNNTYFSPVTSEIKFDGMVMQSPSPGDPTNPVNPNTEQKLAPARKLYV